MSDIDYAGVHEVLLLDRATDKTLGVDSMNSPAHGVQLPPGLGRGPVRSCAGALALAIHEVAGGTRLGR